MLYSSDFISMFLMVTVITVITFLGTVYCHQVSLNLILQKLAFLLPGSVGEVSLSDGPPEHT
jgi:hypothetical protein